jgi:hypothetical protein
MMMFHSFQQFMQQIPILTTTNLLHMISDNNRPAAFDPLAEIRNGKSMFVLNLHRSSSSPSF